MQSPYQKTLTSAAYSVSKTEELAVKIAKQLCAYTKDKDVLNFSDSSELVSFLCTFSKHSSERVLELLKTLFPLEVNGVNLLRLSYAVLNYFKYFDKDDTTACPPYDGSTPITAHAKIIEALPYLVGNSVLHVRVKFMLMTSIFAGSVKELILNYADLNTLTTAIGMNRISGIKEKPYPQELFGNYCTVTLGNKPNKVAVIKNVSATPAEKKLNKRLRKDRAFHVCGSKEHCAFCKSGIRECALACRYQALSED